MTEHGVPALGFCGSRPVLSSSSWAAHGEVKVSLSSVVTCPPGTCPVPSLLSEVWVQEAQHSPHTHAHTHTRPRSIYLIHSPCLPPTRLQGQLGFQAWKHLASNIPMPTSAVCASPHHLHFSGEGFPWTADESQAVCRPFPRNRLLAFQGSKTLAWPSVCWPHRGDGPPQGRPRRLP